MAQEIEISVIILNYNTQGLLKECLRSLHNSEIIVVDNASSDGSVKMVRETFPEVKLIVNPHNYGFAKGNNLGIREAKWKYVLLLNSDTVVEKDTLPVMLKFMEQNPKVGVATCRVELGDGSLDPACHRGFPTPWASLTYFLGLEKIFPKVKLFAQYHQTYKDLRTTHEIDSPTGAFYLVRREVIEEVGMLDENFFFYAEDLDWSYRIKQAGWKIMYVPEVKITHLKRQSGRENVSSAERKKATDYFYSTMKLFYQKHFVKKYPFFVNCLMNWGIDFKWWLTSRSF